MVSTRLTQGPELSWRTRSEANHFLDRYIARSSVLVYYNPDNISEAVLEPDGGGLEPALWLGIALVLSGLGVLITYDRIG